MSEGNRRFLFTYRYNGAEYGLDVVAASAREATERVGRKALARYDGEIFATIRVPGAGLVGRLIAWMRGEGQ
jgi:hypothetical protein